MSAQTCSIAGCNLPRHPGKPMCLEHYKNSDDYTYGMDTELKEKFAAKLDPNKQAQATQWLEQLSGESSAGQSFHEWLKSGVVLCKAINAIKPGTVPRINTMNTPFKQRENIANYLEGCKKLGLREVDVFMTEALYESHNLVAVVDNLFALAGAARKQPGYNGPVIGVKFADPNKRNFTDEQLKEFVPSRQCIGSYGYQDESRNPILSRQIIKNVVGGKSVDWKPKAGGDTAPPSASSPVESAPSAAPAGSGGGGFCGSCGTPREANAKFCAQCGAPRDS